MANTSTLSGINADADHRRRILEAKQEHDRQLDEAKQQDLKDNPIYRVIVSDSAKDLEDELNRIADKYELVSIADTNSYITAAVRRKGF